MPLLADLDIVNAACAVIGADPMQSLTEDTGGGPGAELIYQEVVEFNFGIYPFSFAREVRALSIDDNAHPLTGYSRVFDLPPQRIGPPLYVTDDASNPDRRFSAYKLSGDQVHTDAEALAAEIKFRPPPHRWSATFRGATITAVAARLAYSLAADRGMAEELHREAYGPPVENYRGGMMRAAINEDSQATPPRAMATWRNPLERARRS